MSAVRWPIVLEEGSDFDLQVAWEDGDCRPIDVTGYGARMIVSNRVDASTALLTASIANGRVTLSTVSGVTSEFVISIPAASVDAIKDDIGDDAGYTFVVWPGASTPDANPKRLVHGPVHYSQSYEVD